MHNRNDVDLVAKHTLGADENSSGCVQEAGGVQLNFLFLTLLLALGKPERAWWFVHLCSDSYVTCVSRHYMPVLYCS